MACFIAKLISLQLILSPGVAFTATGSSAAGAPVACGPVACGPATGGGRSLPVSGIICRRRRGVGALAVFLLIFSRFFLRLCCTLGSGFTPRTGSCRSTRLWRGTSCSCTRGVRLR
jgi:hypothetical protein